MLAIPSSAQNQPQFDQQQSTGYDAKQKVQACMENIDQTQMRKFQQMGAEINDLCAAGERDQVQERSLEFAE